MPVPALPLIPDEEVERLAVLQDLNILDTPPEPSFDAVARVAADLCQVPVVVVSLIDRHRQWFKARIGLDEQEMPRERSFCAHLVSLKAPLEVLDPRSDSRFSFNPAVTSEPGIRFYAGMPLMSAGGHVIGSICVVDTEKREPLSERQWDVLKVLASGTVAQMEQAANERALLRLRCVVDALEEDQENLEQVLSHDLLEPLRSISGHLKLVERREAGRLSEGSSELFGLAVRNALRMGGMLDRLLAYLQFGRHEMHPEVCSADDLVWTAWQSLHPERLYPTARLDVESLPNLRVDASQCLVLFRQILDNALRFVPDGRDPRIHVSAERKGGELIVRIADNGIGLRADEARHIFRLFSHGASRELGGGNGLTLAQRIMLRHGGRLRLRPRGGEAGGTLVSMHFPA